MDMIAPLGSLSGLPRRAARSFLALVSALTLVSTLPAQVTVSNLGETTVSNFSVSSGQWTAVSFTTDSGSYTLSSVTLAMDNAVNTSGNFFVGLYSASGAVPGTLVETLSGNSNPATLGNYTYTSTGSSLSPNTTYFVAAGVSSGSGDYPWLATNSASQSNSGGATWVIGDNIARSFNTGSSWSNTGNILQMSVTAVPEPSTYAALFGAAALGLAAGRRRSAA